MENTPAPINQIHQEIFSLIPGQCNMEEALIMLTHVFRGWREQLISFSLLWTSLDCASVNQTRVYLESSKVSPLNIYGQGEGPSGDDCGIRMDERTEKGTGEPAPASKQVKASVYQL
jgi:hypothetical protein